MSSYIYFCCLRLFLFKQLVLNILFYILLLKYRMFDFWTKNFKKGICLYHLFPYWQQLCNFSILCFYFEKLKIKQWSNQYFSNHLYYVLNFFTAVLCLQQNWEWGSEISHIHSALPHRLVSLIIHTPYQSSALVIIDELTWAHHH